MLACCLGAVSCLALSQALNVGLLLPGHTRKNLVGVLLAMVISIVAGLVLVPRFGMEGAAISRLLGALALVGTTALLSERVFTVAFPVREMALVATAAAIAAVTVDHILGAGHGLFDAALELACWTAGMGGIALLLLNRTLLPRNGSPASAS